MSKSVIMTASAFFVCGYQRIAVTMLSSVSLEVDYSAASILHLSNSQFKNSTHKCQNNINNDKKVDPCGVICQEGLGAIRSDTVNTGSMIDGVRMKG